MDIDLNQIRELMQAMKDLDVNELELELEDERVYLRRGAAQADPSVPASTTVVHTGPHTLPPPAGNVAAAAMPIAASDNAAPEADDKNFSYITTPFVGTFYRSPGPDQSAFVDVGSAISNGSVLCIIEAMKLMNEIESEINGTIVEILVENGKPVEYGDRLFKVKTS